MSRSRMVLVIALVGRKLSPFTQVAYLARTSVSLYGASDGANDFWLPLWRVEVFPALSARSMVRSRAFGPSGGAGCASRLCLATSRIRSSLRPSSSLQRRTCSLGGHPCHQPGRSEVGSMPSAFRSSSKKISKLSPRACAHSSSFTGFLTGSLTGLVSSFETREWSFLRHGIAPK